MKYNTNKKLSISYKGLSRDEIYLISRAKYEKQKFITGEYAYKLFNDYKKSANVLSRLNKKGWLMQIERGKYIVIPIEAPNQSWSPNEFITAKLWMGDTPYYVGYFTMYNYWGFTEQVPQTVFVLNTKKSCTKIINDVCYKAVKIDRGKYFGIKKARIENESVLISDKERTLVDFIYYPIGAFENVKDVLEKNIKNIDSKKFINYLIKFPIVAVRKRAGYLLEELNFDRNLLKKLKKSTGNKTSFINLNPYNSSRKGKVNKVWGVIINE